MPRTDHLDGHDAGSTWRRCERVQTPRDDQGIVNSLSRAYDVGKLPDDMRRLLDRIR